MKTGIELIAQEREEQITKHGRTVEQDVRENDNFQLTLAAAMLTAPNPKQFATPTPGGWSWKIWNRMINKPYKERIIIAGALIAAEIDRLQNSPPLTSQK